MQCVLSRLQVIEVQRMICKGKDQRTIANLSTFTRKRCIALKKFA